MPWFQGLLAALLAVLTATMTACGSNGGGSATVPAAGTPVVQTVAEGQSALAAARLDAAKRLGVEPLAVVLHDVEGAGFSGSCVGVRVDPNQACTADLGAGFVAFFRAANGDLRYHFLGRKFVGPVAPSQVSGVATLPSSLHVDIGSALALYAREETALREKVAASTLAVVNIAPDSGGASVLIQGGGKTGAYRASALAGVAVAGALPTIPAPIASIELAMRQDLARRLNADIASISILNYEFVTWPDGCLGVQKPGTVCTQALVPGFLAILSDGVGKTYRYHGTADAYVAASFESRTLTDPIWNP